MAPKFIIDINVADTSAEDQMAACQRILEEQLEDFSATPLVVEALEGEDNVGVDTREEKEPEPEPVKPTKAAPKPGKSKAITELQVIISRDAAGVEGIATIKGHPIVFGNPVKFEEAKKLLRGQLQNDPPPAGMKFFAMRFKAEQMLGEVK